MSSRFKWKYKADGKSYEVISVAMPTGGNEGLGEIVTYCRVNNETDTKPLEKTWWRFIDDFVKKFDFYE